MWTLFALVNLLALCSAVSTTPPRPINVSFSSVNLRNVLHWFAGNGTPDDTFFTVQYAIYGDTIAGSKGRRVNWRAVQQCTDIARTWCDLSSETWDVEQGYHARVRAVGGGASSKWALTSRRFDPKSDTTFGPPLLSVEIENNSAIITLRGPMRFLPNNRTPALSMASIYHHMTYNLSIRNNHRDQTHHLPVVTSQYKYRLLEYSTEYCFSAKSRFLSMPVHCQSSAWHCKTTPRDPVIEQLQVVIVGIVVPSLFICVIVVVGYLLYHYVAGRGQKSPYILDSSSFRLAPFMHPPDKFNLTKVEPQPDSSVPEGQLHIPDPPPRYSPQRIDEHPEAEEPCDDTSSIYAFHSMASEMNPRGVEEGGRRNREEGGDGNDVTGSNKNEESSDGHPAGVYAPQAKSFTSQGPTHTCKQTHTRQTEGNALVRAHAWSQINPTSPAQTQSKLPSSQRPVTRELNIERKNGGVPGLFLCNDPKTGLISVLQNLQREQNVEEKAKVDEKIVVEEEEGKDCELVSLLSSYPSGNMKSTLTSYSAKCDCLSRVNAVLGAAVMQNAGEDYLADDGEEVEEAMCNNWNPQTRKTGPPETKVGLNMKEGLNGMIPSERGKEDRMPGKDGETYAMKGNLTLESVFVRQTSEEERSQAAGSEVEDILTKWDLVIMDQ
ncbi:unnamed protein product [Menidia menidia]|uniref:(Atlantic silverside) hypothetical protein n=1 Tax=Menidia menidia TaxID=238744 RepID=A0A8S4BA91_9TELE|nr:unnamed protein product [Menidia menidia]